VSHPWGCMAPKVLRIGVGDLHWTDSSGMENVAVNDSDKAAALQGFFSSVYAVEPDGKFDSLPDMNNKILTQMTEFSISEGSVYNKLCNLNISKSPGPDMLHPRVLYESRNSIASPLFQVKGIASLPLP